MKDPKILKRLDEFDRLEKDMDKLREKIKNTEPDENTILTSRQLVHRDNFTRIYPEKGKHTHTLIFMHGMWESANKYRHIFDKKGIMNFGNLKVVLPQGPQRHLSVIDKQFISGWFDVHYNMNMEYNDFYKKDDEKGLLNHIKENVD